MIKTTQHCDRCQIEIEEEKERPGFPQLSWCFFRKTLAVFRDAKGMPVLGNQWSGKVNRLEFCQAHGQAFNVLLKGFIAADSRVISLTNTLQEEDLKAWSEKQEEVKAEHAVASEAWLKTVAKQGKKS